jgi:soluble lytic murein transglycosylase-like protein
MAVTISLHPGAAHHDGHHVTVRAGDTLSSISQHVYGTSADWPALWWVNRKQVPDPATVRVGQRLALSDWHRVRPWLTRASVAAIPKPAPVAAPATEPASTAAPVQASSPVAAPTAAAPASSYNGAPGSFQSCVIRAESNGNAQAVNPSSGAGGLYGFLPSTWQSLGFSGLPQNASVSQQNAAFAKEYGQSGGGAWSAYDGC